jgi:hypothetical protein
MVFCYLHSRGLMEDPTTCFLILSPMVCLRVSLTAQNCRVLDLMIKLIGPLYSLLHFTNYYLQLDTLDF